MRFTIRDVLLLTLIVGLTAGWWLDHRKLSHELTAVKKWRNGAGALEHALTELGWEVEWDWDVNVVRATYRGKGTPSHLYFGMDTNAYPPNSPPE